MKHQVTWLSVLPMALAMVNLANAGFRCGGCSDPCRPTHSHFKCGNTTGGYASGSGCGMGMSTASGYSGYSIFEASPASCGAVAADGSYGMSYGQMGLASSSMGCTSVPTNMVMQAPSQVVMQTPVAVAPQVICEPVTGYRTVMESTFVTETQYVNAMETKQETRTRVKKVSRSVPVTVDDFRTKTVMVPTTENKTIEYTVLVPEQSTKTVDVTVTVPVWNEVSENYTIKVPTISDVVETYNVNVARLKDESFTYTVFVPQTETVTKIQTVTNAVPVVKTRTVQRTIPSYSTQSVTKDYGHWETVVEEVAGSSYAAAPAMPCAVQGMVYSNGCGNATGCGNAAMPTTAVYGGGCGNRIFTGQTSGCGCARTTNSCGCGQCGTAVAAAPTTMTTTRRVWVPNVVTEEVPVVTNTVQNEEVAYTVYEQQSTQIPYECAYLVYRPEQRTGTKKVVEYVPEPRSRTRKVVNYTDEQRTRTRRVLSYTTQTKQESYPVVTYNTEKKTKDISFTVNVPTQTVEAFQTTRYETVTEDVVEEYVVNVQVPTTKEVQVQVCKMVPKLVAYTFNPCCASGVLTNGGTMGGSTGGCGCGGTAPITSTAGGCGCGATIVAPVASNCGCAN